VVGDTEIHVIALMTPAEEAFEAMRRSVMVDWVGGGDPAVVGRHNFGCIAENLVVLRSHRVLDFGCGIGRTSVPLAEFLTEGELVGIDIVPAQIKFCCDQIAPRFSNARFYATAAKNRQYDHRISAAEITIGENEFAAARDSSFDLVGAFSVFTHFDPEMAAKYLRYLALMTAPTGHLLLSWFIDHGGNPPDQRLRKGEQFRDTDNLLFALFSLRLIEELAAGAGLEVLRITYGAWRGNGDAHLRGQHYQDVTILRHVSPR
jgi:SAM-dependent methyltransferase